MKKYPTIILIVLTTLISCNKDDGIVNSPATNSPNILLIIADDLGKDAINGYSEGSIKPNTPNLDDIRNNGITFNNLWVYPTCSPTRASIITGKYGYRTNVKWAGDVLSNSENILHNKIKTETNSKYATAVIGKWHLAGDFNTTFNPENLGMDYYAGLLSGGGGYTQWNLTEDGNTTVESSYITEKFTDLSIDWINAQNKPWFLWLAYTAPHTPFHLPPNEMHSQGNLPEYSTGMNPIPYYMAAIEAMDYQIGRLLDNLTEEEKNNTIFIFIGDNGTPNQVAQAPYSSSTAKGSLFQGGINTPMFVSGAGVSRTGNDENLITGTDLYATVAEIAGVTVNTINDSKSFTSLFSNNQNIRNYQYSEKNDGTTDAWTISNGNYKLIVNSSGEKQMYDLLNDPYENTDLLSGTLTTMQEEFKLALEAELSLIRN